MKTVFVLPAPGRLVRDPVTHERLSEEGATKPRNTYWLRRLRDGDCVEAQPAHEAHATETPTRTSTRRAAKTSEGDK